MFKYGPRFRKSQRQGRALAAVVVGLLAASLVVGSGSTAPAQAQAAGPPPDGAAAETAAPSCWAIKQSYPSSADGIYWLQTPKLVAPQQFYCDMTTDGGGWVLIGRGRDGWAFAYTGQGTPGNVRQTPSGTGAFAPAALPGQTIDGLLDGGRVDALIDGVRLRRARSTDGSQWQDMRWFFSSRDRWSWGLAAGHPLSSVRIDGAAFGGGNTREWGVDNAFRRVTTFQRQSLQWKAGFSYGSQVTGSSSSTNYLWTTGTGGFALPFTQVFIRPRITSASYPTIPDAGLGAQRLRPLMSTRTSTTTPWGVTGVVGGGAGENNIEVEAMAQHGNTMYVGGKFQYVQRGANPAPSERIQQSYLAAFDVATGEWRSGFRPMLNGTVWDIQPAPDGRIVVGGEFTNANGAADTAGIAALDPVTGATMSGWRAAIEDQSATPAPRVRALDLQDGWIYVGGTFTHIRGGDPVGSPIQVGRGARVQASNGRPDATWKPVFNGEVIDLDASAQGDRVYFSGHFTTLFGAEARKVAALTTSAPAQAVPGLPTNSWVPSSSDVQKQYQQAIREFGNSVWQGGSEHIAGKYNRDTYAFQRSMTTNPNGGDIQALAEVDGVVYIGCHCTGFAYQDSRTWPTPTPGWTQADGVNVTIAFDAQTMELLPEFLVSTNTRAGNGTWELTPDSNGCLWFGGDFTRGSFQSTAFQWLGGFGKVCARDTNPPSTPTNLRATSGSNGVSLAWNASSSGDGLRYEVLRNDRVVATTTGTSYTDTRLQVGQTAKYWVRAIDDPGNRSATTSAVTGTRTVTPVTLVAYGSTWRWRYDGSDPGASWTQPAFDDSAWAAGPGELGFGDADEATVIYSGPTPLPMTAYFRQSVNVTDPAQFTDLVMDLIRDDGVVVYINGVEVARENMPSGAVGPTTPATTGLSTRSQETTPVTFHVPPDVLGPGSNTIAVEVHQANAWSADLSFNLRLRGLPG